MSELSESTSEFVSQEKGKYQNLAFKIFAVVGFLSSVVTIFGWLNSTSPALTTEITEKTIELPNSLAITNGGAMDITVDSSIDDVLQKYCNPVSVDYDGSKSKNYFYNQVTCEKQKQIFEALKGVLSTGGKPLLAYDIKISNDGGDVAENIKVRSPIDVQASAFDQDGNSIKISSLQDGRLFSIPALNPRESATVRLVSTTPVRDEYDDSPTKPSVTFSGGKASSRDFIYVSSRYAEVVKFLDSISLFFQILTILVGAFIITMIWILPLSLMAEAAQKRQPAKTEEAKTV